jgi:hypothetical protein
MESLRLSVPQQAVDHERPRFPGWAHTAAITVGLAAGTVALFYGDPRSSPVFPPCPFRWVTGLYCPGCGSLRAAHSLLHGQVREALSMNPLLVLSIPLLTALRDKRSWAYRVWVPWAALFAVIAFGVLRNIPVWPFHLLGPN